MAFLSVVSRSKVLFRNKHALDGCRVFRSLSSIVPSRTDNEYDIIIAGGGMVGSTMACALAKNSILSHLKMLLIESSPKADCVVKQNYSNRVSALNNNTKSLMNSIGAWEHIKNLRCKPVVDMHVWDACSDAFITFNEDSSEDAIAYIVENDVLLFGVETELNSVNSEQLDVLYGSSVASVEIPKFEPNRKVFVKVQNGNEYRCKLLIGADGANSKVRSALGAQYLSWKYEQMGVVATLQLSDAGDNSIAWQRFNPTGPIALLPLDECYSSLVWSLPTDTAKAVIKMSEEEFVDALNDALWKKYPHYGLVTSAMSTVSNIFKASNSKQLPPCISGITPNSRAAFPLGFGHSARYVDDGVALIGDAAHRVHPLAGQGVNLGFGDVSCLVELLADSVYSGETVGNYATLARYETLRQRHNVPTQFTIDALHRLYTTDAMPIVLARSVGLQVVNALLPLKRAFMDHARN